MENGVALDSIDVQTCSFLGVNELQSHEFSIAPNLASDVVQIKLTSVPNAEYSFVSASGQIVKTGKIENFEGIVNIGDLENGYYFIRMKTMDGVFHRKLLVSN